MTLTGSAQEVAFEFPSGKYLVKNFGSGAIFVSFEESVASATSIKIASGMAQVCLINERGDGNGQPKQSSIWISGTGEVEVQQLWV